MRLRLSIRGALTLSVLGLAIPQAACGKVGDLQQPAPLFSERAKEQYRAQQAAAAAAAQRRANGSSNAIADQPDPTDNTPPTRRSLQAPEQRLTPMSQDPLPGTISDPRGAQPSVVPPN